LPILEGRRQLIGAATGKIIETATIAQQLLAASDEFDGKMPRDQLQRILRDVIEHSQRLIKCIEQVPLNTFSTTLIDLRTRPAEEPILGFSLNEISLPPRGHLLTDLRQLREASSRALVGRRTTNRVASEVTNVVAWWYRALTGKAATRITNSTQPREASFREKHGEFEALLAEVFAVLEITANAEQQARNFTKYRRSPRYLARLLSRKPAMES
jgi:hypothetical protein